jgi:hypothetical protein
VHQWDGAEVVERHVVALAVAVTALGLGPVVHRALGRSPAARAGIDGFVLGGIGGLVALHVLPRVIVTAGWWAAIAFTFGFVSVFLLPRLPVAGRGWAVGLALVALALHAAIDGAGLASGEEALSLAIVLHRLPAGVVIWWLLRPRYGRLKAAGALALVAVATIVGFASMAHAELVGFELAIFEAALSGALLHVIVEHRPARQNVETRTRVAEIGGVALGVGLALLMLLHH